MFRRSMSPPSSRIQRSAGADHLNRHASVKIAGVRLLCEVHTPRRNEDGNSSSSKPIFDRIHQVDQGARFRTELDEANRRRCE
jgi:hypothetical protein